MFYTQRFNTSERQSIIESDLELYSIIDKVLTLVDPIGLAHLKGEYDIEIAEIMANLHNCKSASDCKQLVYEVFSSWFTPALAEKILKEPEDTFNEVRYK